MVESGHLAGKWIARRGTRLASASEEVFRAPDTEPQQDFYPLLRCVRL